MQALSDDDRRELRLHHRRRRLGSLRAGEPAVRSPPLDEAIRAELADYMARRRAELGD